MKNIAQPVQDLAVKPDAGRSPSSGTDDVAGEEIPLAVSEQGPVIRIVAAVAVIVALWWAQVVLIPLVLSVLISYALEPFVSRLVAVHIKRRFAVPVLLISLFALTGIGIYSLRDSAVLFVEQLPKAARTIRQALRPDYRDQPGAVAKVQQAAQELEKAAKEAAGPKIPAGDVTSVRIEEPTFRWGDYVWQGSRSLLELAGQSVVIVCLVYYLLSSGDLYRRKLVRIAGTKLSHKKITVQILEEIDRQIEGFLLMRMLINVIVGIAVWVSFWTLGLPEAGMWGLLAAVLFLIPYVGAAVVVVGAGIAGFVQFGSLGMAGAAGGLALAIAVFEGNFLAPWLMSRVGRMNTLAVFVSLLFWGWIWGMWGLLLAVPIMAAAKAVCERIESLNSYAELLNE